MTGGEGTEADPGPADTGPRSEVGRMEVVEKDPDEPGRESLADSSMTLSDPIKSEVPIKQEPGIESRSNSDAENGLRRRKDGKETSNSKTDNGHGSKASAASRQNTSIADAFHRLLHDALQTYHKRPHLLLAVSGGLLAFLLLAYFSLFYESPDHEPPPPPTFQSHFSLLRSNPFDKLSAELLEQEMTRLAAMDATSGRSVKARTNSPFRWVPSPSDYYYIPPEWKSVLSDSPNVALIFGERGSGKSTLRILAEKHILQLYNLRFSNETGALPRTATGSGVLLIDITPEQQSLNTFFPVLKQNLYQNSAAAWQKLLYTEDDFWKLQFHNHFSLDDVVDMILGRGVTLLVDALVAQSSLHRVNSSSVFSRIFDISLGKWLFVPPLGLRTTSAYELGRFAGTYYMGNTDTLKTMLSMVERDVEFWWSYKKFWWFLRRIFLGSPTSAGSSSGSMGLFGGLSEGSLLAFTGIVLAVYRANLLFFDFFSLKKKLGLGTEAWGLLTFCWSIWFLWWLWRNKWSFLFDVGGILGSALGAVRDAITSIGSSNPARHTGPVRTTGDGALGNKEDNYRPRVIAFADSRNQLLEPFVKECQNRNIRWESSVSRLKSFRKLVAELGYGAMVVLLDGIEETPLSNPLENERVVPHFVKTVLQHPLFEISMDKEQGRETS